ncbi:hypothetical protein LZ24_02808 [Desulfobotulus alkaliphilus]|uniref:Pyridoxal phosphate homeostasis protein n=1 Tax=Desulfobotulus alkaliphilus TaxID=622671 RepID=A0A562RDH4_9BACT|nr:YggS family pyridoxal phosphate-dependent enzyme [Desulfobotulus alkaliphilus]TWI66973.1 hypothetical protein LZ24_02808 [Desulfobotulus alkaliphilus]
MSISQRLQDIKKRMEKICLSCGRNPDSAALVAVSKTKGEPLIREAFEAGQILFGENYVQEATAKAENLAALPISWHFIGHLQRNKARFVVRYFDLIHSVDSLRLAEEIHKQSEKISKIQNILIQVHLGGEESKAGIHPKDLQELLRNMTRLKHVCVQGLMAIPPPVENAEENRIHFKALRELMEENNAANILPAPMTILSMGMSDDFEVAMEEGATLIRIGTAIFGSRS